MADKEIVPVDQTVPPITAERLSAAEQVTGLTFTESEREQLLDFVNETRTDYEKLRAVPLANDVVPAFTFQPYEPSAILPANKVRISLTAGTSSPEKDAVDGPLLPTDLEEIAFWPVTWLAHLIKTRQITSQ